MELTIICSFVEFGAAVEYIGKCTAERLNTPSNCYVVGTQRLPYIPLVYTKVLIKTYITVDC